eukprot:TRINITY_DN18211_c0_g1_i2.p1 TRINITY_DN18211_c0_g1~~TRINITY_DN18211_c0_g1_i2.p1  ORF type:complete len:346 (+),score=31.52 TRINITY_DN18211_c0_g1_i2:32-1039(+)
MTGLSSGRDISLSIFLCFLSFLCVTARPETFLQDFRITWADSHIKQLDRGTAIQLTLDQSSGCGFASKNQYLFGRVSMKIKLVSGDSAGTVTAFYMNSDTDNVRDELDFEFLGNIRGKEWRIQTNVYGNGSTGVGREERYGLWFDPTEDFHQYSIFWSDDNIVFYVDDIPIREVPSSKAMGGDFPSKPMSLYATVWDGSNWATSGGRYKVNYKYAPYIAEFTNLILAGCSVDPIEQSPNCETGDINPETQTATISSDQNSRMESFRKKYMTYTYCYDRERYPSPPPECIIDPDDAEKFGGTDGFKFSGGHHHHHHRRGKRNHGSPVSHHREAPTL